MYQLQLRRCESVNGVVSYKTQKPSESILCETWAKEIGIEAPWVVFTLHTDPEPGAWALEFLGEILCEEFEDRGCCEHSDGKSVEDGHDFCFEDAAQLYHPAGSEGVLIPELYSGLALVLAEFSGEFYFTFSQHAEWQDVDTSLQDDLFPQLTA